MVKGWSTDVNFRNYFTIEGSAGTAAESNCFISPVNDWEFCDITVALELSYNVVETPATISCFLASTSEGVGTAGDQPSGTVQLNFVDTVVNVENRGGYPLLGCTMEPGGIKFFLPYNHGALSAPE